MAEQQHCNKQAQCLGGQHCSNQETKQQAWAQDQIEDGDATHVVARMPWGLLQVQRCPNRSHQGTHRSSNQNIAVRSVGAQPLLAATTTLVRQIHPGVLFLPSICEHGNRRRILDGNLKGQPVHRERISNVGGPVLNRALAGDSSLHEVAQHGEHRQTAVPDLLHLQLGSHIRVVGQTQRVKSLASRVHQIKVASTEWTTVHTLSLDGTHQDNLAGQHGKDGLGAHQHGGTHVVPAIRLQDHGTSLEPHTFAGTIVDGSARLQLLRGQALESTQHSPAIVQHLSLAEALDGLRVRCTPRAVPTVVTRVLNGQVVSDPPVTAACT